MKKVFLTFAFSFLALSVSGVFAETLQDKFKTIDSLLVKGDLSKAGAILTQISYDGAGYSGSIELKTFQSYQVVLEVMEASAAYQNALSAFSDSEKTPQDVETLRRSFHEWVASTNKISGTLHVSLDLVDLINQWVPKNNTSYRRAENDFSAVQSKRVEVEIAKRDADQKAKDQAEADYEAKRQADIKAKEDQDAADALAVETAFNTKLATVDASAKKRGLNGVYREHGLVQFLMECQEGRADLESGLGKVFYTGPRPDGMENDRWRLDQVVSGWEIYSESLGPHDFKIAIKAGKKLQMEGQALKGEFFVFKGNREFTVAINGTSKIVQVFEAF